MGTSALTLVDLVTDPVSGSSNLAGGAVVIPTTLFSDSVTCGVGGIAELPPLSQASPAEADAPPGHSRSSTPLYGAIVGWAAVLVVVLSAGAWYARRRWLR
jgi:hypothetical protein